MTTGGGAGFGLTQLVAPSVRRRADPDKLKRLFDEIMDDEIS